MMGHNETAEAREARIARLRREQFGDDLIANAYAVYDSDPRVNGPDDRDAFRDAVLPLTEAWRCPHDNDFCRQDFSDTYGPFVPHPLEKKS